MCFLEKQKEKLRGVAGTVPFSFLPLAHSDVGQGRSRWSVAYSSSCVFLPFRPIMLLLWLPTCTQRRRSWVAWPVRCPLVMLFFTHHFQVPRTPLQYHVLGYQAYPFPGLTPYTPPLLEQPLMEGAVEVRMEAFFFFLNLSSFLCPKGISSSDAPALPSSPPGRRPRPIDW